MELAPIVLFVYNRPWHTRQTLEALEANNLANRSTLYIFADGAKENASQETQRKVREVRAIIREKPWCHKVIIKEMSTNQGLAKSLISGVSEVISEHGSVIVLEDDLVTGTGFLKFMNQSLLLYKHDKIAGVSGWSFGFPWKPEIYFSRVGACWGWATWKSVWQRIIFDPMILVKKIQESQLVSEFDVDGAYPYFSMLQDNANGLNDSWAVRFYANYFLEGKLFLFPSKSLVTNIGMDGSGVHFNSVRKSENRQPNNENTVPLGMQVEELGRVRDLVRNSLVGETKLEKLIRRMRLK